MAAVIPNQPLREHALAAQASVAANAASAPPKSRLRDVAALPLAILGVAAFIAAFDNGAFWTAVAEATRTDEHRTAILVSMLMTVLCPLIVILSVNVGARTFKTTAAALLLVAAFCGYFIGQYGIVVDPSMIRNLVETQVREASPFLTVPFFVHFAVFGVAPAVLVAWPPLSGASGRCSLGLRAGMIGLAVLAFAATLYASYGAVSYFGAQHRDVRLLLNPAYPLFSAVKFMLREDDHAPVVRAPLDARVAAAHLQRDKPTLIVFVAGETARADRFSFNGYERDTNRYTRGRGVVSFGNVSSCGTSTADSVPCLFSDLGRAHFTHAAASARESLFGTLQRLGVETFWRDNSTGCKQVCDAAHFEEFAARTDAELCDASGCFDEILLEDIDALVADTTHDRFIVLHQRGSHGPAYHTDVPAWSKEFQPECDSAALRNCDLERINNAYDNTILYTDYFLSRVIQFLEAHSHEYDVAMLYVSDHGESLGENGLYLHGLPYALAPEEQTRVPMLFWASPGFYASNDLTRDCVRAAAERDVSHDWIFHTLLPLFGVESAAHRDELDLLASCRRDGTATATLSLARDTVPSDPQASAVRSPPGVANFK